MVARDEAEILVRSVPRRRGLFEMAQIPKWALSSAAVRTPFPISWVG